MSLDHEELLWENAVILSTMSAIFYFIFKQGEIKMFCFCCFFYRLTFDLTLLLETSHPHCTHQQSTTQKLFFIFSLCTDFY